MKIVKKNDEIVLDLGTDDVISMNMEWIDHLSTLPYDQFGVYIKSNIYPALSDKEKMIWNRATISNVELQTALQEYTSELNR